MEAHWDLQSDIRRSIILVHVRTDQFASINNHLGGDHNGVACSWIKSPCVEVRLTHWFRNLARRVPSLGPSLGRLASEMKCRYGACQLSE